MLKSSIAMPASSEWWITTSVCLANSGADVTFFIPAKNDSCHHSMPSLSNASKFMHCRTSFKGDGTLGQGLLERLRDRPKIASADDSLSGMSSQPDIAFYTKLSAECARFRAECSYWIVNFLKLITTQLTTYSCITILHRRSKPVPQSISNQKDTLWLRTLQ